MIPSAEGGNHSHIVIYALLSIYKMRALDKMLIQWSGQAVHRNVPRKGSVTWVPREHPRYPWPWEIRVVKDCTLSFTVLQIDFLGKIRLEPGTSLVAQWLRIHLLMQGTRVQSLIWEDPTCCEATKPMHHNYWACALQPASHNYWAHVPQLLKPAHLEPVLRNKRSHHNEKPAHCKEE